MSSKDPTVRLSKLLSRVLRHQATSMGIAISSDGYVKIDELLMIKEFKSYKYSDILYVVENNDKKRFQVANLDNIEPSIEPSTELLPMTHIRAVQGHSIQEIDSDLLLTEIINPLELPVCIHGTYNRFIDSIITNGLNKMYRNHIHMATGLPHEVISGARKNVEILIYINVSLALSDGIKFYRSNNNVILSDGVESSGIIPAKYFEKIENYDPRRYDSRNHSSDNVFQATDIS